MAPVKWPSFSDTFEQRDALPGGKQAGVSSIGSLPSGSPRSGSDDSGEDDGPGTWGKIGSLLPGVGGLLGAFFGTKKENDPRIDESINATMSGAKQVGAQGQNLFETGTDSLGPVLKYFQALASGDPSQALAATQPQRGRIMDQYDAARRSAGQFGPRGGGQASSQLESRSREAGQLADTTSAARSEGMDKLAALGSDLTKSGLSAEEASNYQMASVLQPLLDKQKAESESSGGFWKGIGELAGAALSFL